jgi:hypothetical protein
VSGHQPLITARVEHPATRQSRRDARP